MRFRLYVIESGDSAEPEFRLIDEIESTAAAAVAKVEECFRTLLLDDPQCGNVFVFSSFGEPPGSIVAAERVGALPGRRLQWVADKFPTGLRA